MSNTLVQGGEIMSGDDLIKAEIDPKLEQIIMGEEIITPIGTLEWDMGTIYDLPAYLESMRPTVEGDKEDYSERYAAQCELPSLHIGASEEDRKKESIQTMMYVINHVIMLMKKDEIEGLVPLVFAAHQLRWNMKIVCNAYVPQPKQV